MSDFKINGVWLFIAVDKNDGDEGVIGMKMGETYMPFVCADLKRYNLLMPLAQKLATDGNQVVKVAYFSRREDVQEIRP